MGALSFLQLTLGTHFLPALSVVAHVNTFFDQDMWPVLALLC